MRSGLLSSGSARRSTRGVTLGGGRSSAVAASMRRWASARARRMISCRSVSSSSRRSRTGRAWSMIWASSSARRSGSVRPRTSSRPSVPVPGVSATRTSRAPASRRTVGTSSRAARRTWSLVRQSASGTRAARWPATYVWSRSRILACMPLIPLTHQNADPVGGVAGRGHGLADPLDEQVQGGLVVGQEPEACRVAGLSGGPVDLDLAAVAARALVPVVDDQLESERPLRLVGVEGLEVGPEHGPCPVLEVGDLEPVQDLVRDGGPVEVLAAPVGQGRGRVLGRRRVRLRVLGLLLVLVVDRRRGCCEPGRLLLDLVLLGLAGEGEQAGGQLLDLVPVGGQLLPGPLLQGGLPEVLGRDGGVVPGQELDRLLAAVPAGVHGRAVERLRAGVADHEVVRELVAALAHSDFVVLALVRGEAVDLAWSGAVRSPILDGTSVVAGGGRVLLLGRLYGGPARGLCGGHVGHLSRVLLLGRQGVEGQCPGAAPVR
jgi:hypothetical protein